ncbi:hypothetical protein [Aquisediminimonas sediminicola]|uniref:hypothetical protein n=1 Tax=Alteraquisediminimonas sediminicola TaxID=2676787 RepID=UPI001C8F1D70|nr:hypothetical protein [Aquisediminimonas sediminicola]
MDDLIKRLTAALEEGDKNSAPTYRDVVETFIVPIINDRIEAQEAEIERLERSARSWEDEARRHAGNIDYWSAEIRRWRAVLEAQATEIARFRGLIANIIRADRCAVHVGYDERGNFIYADAVRLDDDALVEAHQALGDSQ